MYAKRGVLSSLAEIERLDPAVRDSLEIEFLKHFDEMVEVASQRQAAAFQSLERLVTVYRDYHSPFNEDGEIYPDNLIAELAAIKPPTVFQEIQTYQLITELADAIFKAANRIGFSTEQKIVFGTLFTGKINACAIYLKQSDEHLIVFETQLFFFLNRITKIICQCIVLNGRSSEHWEFSTVPEDMVNQIQENRLIQDSFNALMFAFIFDGEVTSTPNIIIPLPHQQIQQILLRSIELFIMGHEYTHVVKHHREAGTKVFLYLNNTETAELTPGWENEFEADSIGVLLAAAAMNDAGFQEDFCLIGPHLFFQVFEIIEEAWAIKYGYTSYHSAASTHPPSSSRRENVSAALKSFFSEEQMSKAAYLPDVLSTALKFLWDNCIPEMRRRAEE